MLGLMVIDCQVKEVCVDLFMINFSKLTHQKGYNTAHALA